ARQAASPTLSAPHALTADFPGSAESNDLMAGSCRSYTAVLNAISIPRFCVTQVPPRPYPYMYWPSPLPRPRPVFVIEVDVRQSDAPPSLERSGDPDLSPSDPAA